VPFSDKEILRKSGRGNPGNQEWFWIDEIIPREVSEPGFQTPAKMIGRADEVERMPLARLEDTESIC